LSGLSLATGFNGNGFSWAAITGQTPAFDLTVFRPGRFAERGTAWENPFTAGERGDAPGTPVSTA
jgi:hypothetical protein